MQEDTTPFSASTSTSHTLSEHSPNVEDVIAANTDPKEAIGGASIAQIDMDGQPLISRKERTAKQPSDKRTKQKRKQNKQRKTPHADPVVPGKKGQYVHLRFHERPEHTITEINKPPPPTS